MSLETIFSSETKIEILRTLSGSNRSFSAGELERETTKNIAGIYRALEGLKNQKIIKEIKTKGKTSYYRLNREKEIVNQIERIFEEEEKHYRVKNIPKKVLNILFNLKVKLSNQLKELKLIILFGSTARGDYTPESDLDLYIVVEDLNKGKEDKIYDLAEKYEHKFSLIIKSQEEFSSDFSEPVSSLADSILKQGYLILYGSKNKVQVEKSIYNKITER